MNRKPMGMKLDISSFGADSMADLTSTFRYEGLSVAFDSLRVDGKEIDTAVSFNDLKMGKRIGQGACSAVNLAEHRVTGERYAVKMFNVYDKGQRAQLTKEVHMLLNMECQALIGLKGTFHNEGSIGVILEFMDKGALDSAFSKKNNALELDECTLAAAAFQMVWGLACLHYDKNIHRDVKPANILVNSAGQVKLSDFGISRTLESGSDLMSCTNVGTLKFMSPERLYGNPYNESSDVWSLGLVIVQLWSSTYPFTNQECLSPLDLIGAIEALDVRAALSCGRSPGSAAVSVAMVNCVASMLVANPADRTTAAELLAAEWFSMYGITCLKDAQELVGQYFERCEACGESSGAAVGDYEGDFMDETQTGGGYTDSGTKYGDDESYYMDRYGGERRGAEEKGYFSSDNHRATRQESNTSEYGEDDFEFEQCPSDHK